MFIKEGRLEPVHLKQQERDILVTGMEETMNKCLQEIDASQQTYSEKTKSVSKALVEQRKNIESLAESFLRQTKE